MNNPNEFIVKFVKCLEEKTVVKLLTTQLTLNFT